MITALSLSPAVDKIYFVDNFRCGGLYRVRNTVKSAGGKGVNVARVASLLGGKVKVLGFKAGETGNWLEAQLKNLGVNTEFIEVEGESRTNNNIIDRLGGTETEVLEIGPYIDAGAINRFLAGFKKSMSDTSVLVCSGGLPEGIPVDFYRTLIEAAGSFGIKVILDTSNEILKEGIKAKPYMVKPNLRELSTYAGRQLEKIDAIIGACEDIISEGVKIVLVSMGGQGALMVSEDNVFYARTPDIEAVNTIGSGDSMVAGCAVSLKNSCSSREILRLGMACAAANTQFKQIGYISRELVDKYMVEIKIDKIV